MFNKDKTIRGFSILWFDDDYGEKCSLQKSSSVEPHIWLGIHEPKHKVLVKDSGWQDYPIPKEVSVHSRMHLNREQAKELGKKLIKFSKTGRLE